MMMMMKQLVCIFSVAILFGCTENKTSEKAITVEILDVKICNSISGEGCLKSYLLFGLRIQNNSNLPVELNENHMSCDIEQISPTISLELDKNFHPKGFWEICPDTTRFGLVLYDKLKNNRIKPKSKVKTDCLLLVKPCKYSLNELKEVYEPMINSNFIMQSTSLFKNHVVVFKKSNDFKKIFLLDNKVVDPNDSIAMSQRLDWGG